MIVLKFGGTSVRDGRQFATVAQLIAARRSEGCLVVVSAMAGVTDELERVGQLAREARADEVERVLNELIKRHRYAISEAGITPAEAANLEDESDHTFTRIRQLVTGVTLLGELTARTSDALLATGELLSSKILAACLSGMGIPTRWIDPRELIVTDTSFGAAVPDEDEIERRVKAVCPMLERGQLVVTGGFVGAASDGQTTTLGRGGSDYTAALLAAALPSSSLEIWTDVDGLLTADPRIVSHARVLPSISFAEAAELAYFGAKVLHPATIRPAVRRGIPVWIKNTFRPERKGTSILRDVEGIGVRAIAARRGTTALFLSNPRMLLAHGYAARIFGIFERHRVPVDVIATSEVSVAITVNEDAPLEALVRELRELVEVEVVRGLAVVTVVGKGLRTMPGVAARVFGALQEINVIMISQGASDTNFTFVLAEGDLAPASLRLHQEFFETINEKRMCVELWDTSETKDARHSQSL